MQRKILFILHFPPPVHGSAVIGGFIRASKVINESFNCRFVNLGTSAAIEDIGRNNLRKAGRYISLIWQVNKQLITFRPELCYLTPTAKGPGFYKDALIITLVKLFGAKTIYHYHNKGISTRQERFFDNILYSFVFRNSNVILLSKHLYPDINKYVLEERVYYCPNGIPEIRDERDRVKVGERCDEITLDKSKGDRRVIEILFLSHLIKSKGVLILIEACEILKNRGLAFYCTIAGADAEETKQSVETIIAGKGLSSFISVVGPKHGEEKTDLMICADIFVHPTFSDCLPLVLLEAMQYSLPVVSTFEGAIPDVVESGVTGFLVPQRDAAALAEELELLIRDPELRHVMGVAGRAKYERQFTLEKFENKMKDILEEVGNS